jgi:hypothetical protein
VSVDRRSWQNSITYKASDRNIIYIAKSRSTPSSQRRLLFRVLVLLKIVLDQIGLIFVTVLKVCTMLLCRYLYVQEKQEH